MSKLTRSAATLALLVAATLGACDKGPPVKPASAPATATAPTATPATAAPATAAPATAAPATAAMPTGTKFGEGVTLVQSEPIDAILADPNAYAGKTVRVEGMITDVCPKRGCWMELAGSAPGQKLKFKVTDGVMVFPMDAKGKRVVAQGVVAVRELSLEESKEHAEYEAKEYGKPYDPASITKPTSVVRLDGTGAVLQ